jgi:hypothetical protein
MEYATILYLGTTAFALIVTSIVMIATRWSYTKNRQTEERTTKLFQRKDELIKGLLSLEKKELE